MDVYDPAPAARLVRAHEELAYPYTFSFGGATLTITDGVFCPLLTNTSSLLLGCLEIPAGSRVLDVFSGSGAFGIVAAMRGASVVSVDTSADAIKCVVANAVANRVESRVEARLGNLSETLASDETFDVVIANPPLLPGDPHSPLETALFDPGLSATTDFLARLPVILRPGGHTYLLLSDVFQRLGRDIMADSQAVGLTATCIAQRDVGYEAYRVYRIEHAGTSARS
jgi:methylase of polypeptide subunit release factors